MKTVFPGQVLIGPAEQHPPPALARESSILHGKDPIDDDMADTRRILPGIFIRAPIHDLSRIEDHKVGGLFRGQHAAILKAQPPGRQ